jgi:lipopolysaccharide export LptBFGC system permease protein LptF
MRIFDRYIARQVLGSTIMAVVVLSVILVLGQMFRVLLDKLVEGVLPLSAIFKFVAYAFPGSLTYTLPWGLLTAVLLTFGRLSADNELISMRMAGQSLLRLCAPVFAVAALLSLLCFWINTVIAPLSITETRRMTRQVVMRDPSVLFASDKTVTQIPGHLIYTGKRDGNHLRNLQVIKLRDGDRTPEYLMLYNEARLFTDKLVQRKAIEIGATHNLFITRSEASPPSEEELAAMTVQEAAAAAARVEADTRGAPAYFELNTESSTIPIGMSMLMSQNATVKATGLTMEQLRQGMEGRRVEGEDMEGMNVPAPSVLRTEYHRRISFSLACFVLALVGIPFGISAQRRETSSGFLLSLIVGIAYFSLIMLGDMWKNKPEKYPWLWIWLPNVLFGTLGILKFRQLQRK